VLAAYEAFLEHQRKSASNSPEATSTASSSSLSKERLEKRVNILIQKPKGECGRKSKDGRPGYSLADASRLDPVRYKNLYVS